MGIRYNIMDHAMISFTYIFFRFPQSSISVLDKIFATCACFHVVSLAKCYCQTIKIIASRVSLVEFLPVQSTSNQSPMRYDSQDATFEGSYLCVAACQVLERSRFAPLNPF